MEVERDHRLAVETTHVSQVGGSLRNFESYQVRQLTRRDRQDQIARHADPIAAVGFHDRATLGWQRVWHAANDDPVDASIAGETELLHTPQWLDIELAPTLAGSALQVVSPGLEEV